MRKSGLSGFKVLLTACALSSALAAEAASAQPVATAISSVAIAMGGVLPGSLEVSVLGIKPADAKAAFGLPRLPGSDTYITKFGFTPDDAAGAGLTTARQKVRITVPMAKVLEFGIWVGFPQQTALKEGGDRVQLRNGLVNWQLQVKPEQWTKYLESGAKGDGFEITDGSKDSDGSRKSYGTIGYENGNAIFTFDSWPIIDPMEWGD